MTAKRNGKIELLRFVFCMGVIFYHINNDLWDGTKVLFDGVSFFSHGRTGVEFFFLVTGYLAAKSAAKVKLSENKLSVGTRTYDFMLRKIKTVFPAHMILCTLMIIILLSVDKLTMEKFLDKLPSLFFLQTTGLTTEYFLSVEWYICSMLFALVIIYPLLLKSFDFTSKILAPVGSAMLIGYMITKYHRLPSSLIPDPILCPNNLRALAVVLLGVFCYTISEKIRNTELSKRQKCILAAAENFCWIMSLYFIISNVQYKYEGIIVYILALAVSLTFSRDFTSKLYNNAFVTYLGRLSLTVYLSQNVVRNFVRFYVDYDNRLYVLLVTVLTIALGMAVDFICAKLSKLKLSK